MKKKQDFWSNLILALSIVGILALAAWCGIGIKKSQTAMAQPAIIDVDWVDQIIEQHGAIMNLTDLIVKWDEHGKMLISAVSKSGECWEYIATKYDDPNYNYEIEYRIIIFRKCGETAWTKWEDR